MESEIQLLLILLLSFLHVQSQTPPGYMSSNLILLTLELQLSMAAQHSYIDGTVTHRVQEHNVEFVKLVKVQLI